MKRIHLPLIFTCLIVLLAGAGLLLGPGQAQAQIVVTGPPTETAQALTAWFGRHIPAKFQAHERFEVQTLNDSEMDAYVHQGDSSTDSSNSKDDDGDIDGVFADHPPQITLRVPEGNTPDFFTFAHEYGHYVWFDLLSKDDRHHYEAIYQKQKAAHKLITDYAGAGVEEGFAEAFAAFVTTPAALRHQDPLSAQFLCHWPGTAQ